MDINNHKKNVIWFVVFGLIGFITFFYTYPQIDDLSNLNLQFSKDDVLRKIEGISETHNLNFADYKLNVELRRNDRVVEYAQKKFGLKKTANLIQGNVHFPAYFWNVEYTTPNQSGESKRERNVVVGGGEQDRILRERGKKTVIFEISTTGKLIRFEKIFPPDSSRVESTEQVDESQTEKFLHDFLQTNISNWELKERRIDQRRGGVVSRFHWVKNQVEWSDSLTAVMEFKGDELRRFNLLIAVDEKEEATFSIKQGFEISIVFIILIISIFVLIGFIKRLRQDKIEFRNSWIVAILAAVALSLTIIPNAIEDSLLEMILGVLFASPLIGICAFILTAVSESVAREIWNEKLFGYDRLLKGNIHSHKLGYNLIIGFFGGGLILGILTMLVFVYNKFGIVFFQYDGDEIRNFIFGFPFLKTIGSDLLMTIFLFFGVLVFVVSYVKRFFKKDLLFIIIIALTFAIIPFKIISVSPIFVRICLNFLLGFFLSWILLRYDLLTAGVALLSVIAFVSAVPYFAEGSPENIMNGLFAIIVPISMLSIGFIVVFSKDVADDEKEYVPDYVIRSRERERFQRELEIARNVQMRFLPQKLPDVMWLDVATNCTPAYEVGGDYYDFLKLDNNRFGVVVGDVSGKGVSAAFYMTLMKGILKSQTRLVQSPKEVLIQINDLFYENAQRGVFISMIYGVFDQKRNTFTFARAGHNPLISLFRQKGHAEEISPKGIAIGLDKGLVFNQSLEESSITVNPGDVFVFYTDGYTEAMDEHHNEFGEDRLIDIVNKNFNLSANVILSKIQEQVGKFTKDTQQHDDMTMVVVKVCESD